MQGRAARRAPDTLAHAHTRTPAHHAHHTRHSARHAQTHTRTLCTPRTQVFDSHFLGCFKVQLLEGLDEGFEDRLLAGARACDELVEVGNFICGFRVIDQLLRRHAPEKLDDHGGAKPHTRRGKGTRVG